MEGKKKKYFPVLLKGLGSSGGACLEVLVQRGLNWWKGKILGDFWFALHLSLMGQPALCPQFPTVPFKFPHGKREGEEA